MKCKQQIDLGVYHEASRFFFVVDENKGQTEFRNIYNHFLSLHPNVGIIQNIKEFG